MAARISRIDSRFLGSAPVIRGKLISNETDVTQSAGTSRNTGYARKPPGSPHHCRPVQRTVTRGVSVGDLFRPVRSLAARIRFAVAEIVKKCE